MGEGKIVLVASGLRDIGGHNYSYTREVETELKGRGFSVDVMGHQLMSASLRGETGYRPVFSRGTYNFPFGANVVQSMAKLWAQAGVYADELSAGLALEPSPRVVFCHTLSDFELVGWSRFLTQRLLPCALVLMLRETPGFANLGFYRRWLHPYTGLRARCLRSIKRHARAGFVLATDTEELAQDYACIFDGRIRAFPIPVPMGSPATPAPRDRGVITMGYVGDCRAAKGFARLAPMIEQVIANDPRQTVFFRVQLYKGSYHDGGIPPGWSALESISTRFPKRLELVRGVLNADDYGRLFRSISAVLIPNDHPAFQSGSSNVFCEAAAYGKPVVVPEGTWMAGQLARYGGGACFRLADPASFGQAVLRLAGEWEAACKKAENFSGEWSRQHNPSSLVDALIAASTPGLS